MDENKNGSPKALPELLTQQHVAAYLGVTTRTIATYKAQGLLPYVQIGRLIRFRYEDIRAFIAEYMVEPRNSERWKQ